VRLVTLTHRGNSAAAVLGDAGASPVGDGAFPDVGALLRAGEEGLEAAQVALTTSLIERPCANLTFVSIQV
jgi:hypothetical protein